MMTGLKIRGRRMGESKRGKCISSFVRKYWRYQSNCECNKYEGTVEDKPEGKSRRREQYCITHHIRSNL
jgi:hypothetical protein